MENELMHFGVKGQKWGVRRYQNPDGSLTLAGKKRALKVQNDYTELSKNKKYHDKDGNLTYEGRKRALKMKEQYSSITGKSLRPFPNASGLKSSTSVKGESKVKPKSISEMSNEEIKAKIDRIHLENALKTLEPKKVSIGQRFINTVKDTAISFAMDRGTRIVGDYIEKQLRDKLGLTNKQVKSASELLKEKAQDMENAKKIAQAEDYFSNREKQKQKQTEKEQQQKNDTKNKTKTETYTGTVKGEGTSKRSFSDKKTNFRTYDEPIDAEWREVNSEPINSGRSYVNQLLLEDKRYK